MLGLIFLKLDEYLTLSRLLEASTGVILIVE